LQNSPLESSCVVVALVENYSTSKPLKVSPEKSHILTFDTVVANERYVFNILCAFVWNKKKLAKLKFTLEQTTRAQWGRRGIAILFI